jgi:hypothetical protein
LIIPYELEIQKLQNELKQKDLKLQNLTEYFEIEEEKETKKQTKSSNDQNPFEKYTFQKRKNEKKEDDVEDDLVFIYINGIKIGIPNKK